MNEIQIDQPKEEAGQSRKGGFGLEPLFTWRGLSVYPFFGAEGDDEGTGEPDSGSDDDTDDDAGEGSSDSGSASVTRAEFEQLRKQLSAADKRREAAEGKLKELDDAKKDELTKATERAEAAEKQVQERDTQLAELRLENAFLTATTGITWHDPADALALAQRQGYLAEVVDEGGKVDSAKLAAKLKELAKAKPHLVKTSGSKDGDQKGGGEKKPPSGQTVGSRGTNGGKGGEEKLPARYDRYLNR